MNDVAWSSVVRILLWTLAVALLAAAALDALLSFEAFGPRPERGADFIEFVRDVNRWEQDLWPIEFGSAALTAVAFLAIGALGSPLRRLTGPDDGRRGLVSASLLLSGFLGVASQLVWIGAKPIATRAEYCDCGLLEEEVMSRLMVLDATRGIRDWLLNGALIVLALGLVVVANIGRKAGMPAGWRWLSFALVAAIILPIVLGSFDIYPVDLILLIATAAVLVPIWALWLARYAPVLWPPSEAVRPSG